MYTVQVHPSIYRITTPYEGGGVVYLYLLKGDQIALVDSGAQSSPVKVLPAALAEIGMSLANVDIVLNTHGHLDHAGGNASLRKQSNAKLFINPADLFLCSDLQAEIKFHLDPLRALEFPKGFIGARRKYVSDAAGVEKTGVDGELSDGQVVDLGGGIRLSVIHTPGHTPGHVVLYWESEGVLLTADAIQGQGSRPGGYPYYFQAADYRRSLAKLSKIPFRTLCMGHGYIGGSPISDATRTGEDATGFMKESIRVADAIHRAVSEAVKRMPGASRRQIALAALDDLVYEIPEQRLRDTNMPASAGPALNSHIDSVLDGTYPE